MRGCLVIHGLTGVPSTVSSVSDALLAQGFQVAAPCLPGHGGSLDDLTRSTWSQWYETVRVAYNELRRNTEKVYFAGLSLGALLGLKLAADEGWGLRALALMGTPLKLGVWNRIATPFVRYTPLGNVITSLAKDPSRSVEDPEGQRHYIAATHQRIPTASVFELCDLQKTLHHDMHNVRSPLLLLHAKADALAPFSNVALIRRRVSSEVVETLAFHHSQHVITMDREKEKAAQAIVDFFNRFP